MNTVNCILFDLDGTLVDTWRLYIETYRLSFESFYGRLMSDEEIRQLKPASEKRVIKKIAGEDCYEDYLEKFYYFYEKLHDQYFDGIYDGIKPLLHHLQEKNFTTGIVTGKSRRALEITLSKCGLGGFDVIVTDDTLKNPKPDPEGILRALSLTGTNAGDALYCGDSIVDLRAALSANLKFTAVLWSKSREEIPSFKQKAMEAGPCDFFTSPLDMLPYLMEKPGPELHYQSGD